MAATSSDILMIVVGKKGRLQAEGTTDFAQRTSGDLSSDFFSPMIFELQEFNFSVGVAPPVADDEDDDPADGAAKGKTAAAAARSKANARRSASTRNGQGTKSDIIDIQPVKFTRLFDSASTQLFTSLVTCETIRSISIIKRKAAGSRNSGEAYLRLDFTEVLLTDLDWAEEADLIKETGTFIYRKLKVSYRPQKADGSLDVVKNINWTMKS